MKIANKNIGGNQPCFIIAELSANHNGNIEIAKKTIKAAKKAGADAIKLQTYTAETLTLNVKSDLFLIKNNSIWDGQYLYELYQNAYTPWEWHEELFAFADKLGLVAFSSPFDNTAVDFLERLNVPAYKIASFEIQDIPLITYVASKMKPVIISTGIAQLSDIELAVETCKSVGNEQIILLKCTSSYPAPMELANLRTIPNLRETFSVEVGLSDHTKGTTVPVVATSLGAKVIEKHFILDRSLGGPDADFSLDVNEFTEMVTAVRKAEKALGSVTYELSEKVKANKKFARSLFVVRDLKKGEILTNENVRSIRPGYGLHPRHYKEVLGKKALKNIQKGTPLKWHLID